MDCLLEAEFGDGAFEGDDIEIAIVDRVGAHACDVGQRHAFDDIASVFVDGEELVSGPDDEFFFIDDGEDPSADGAGFPKCITGGRVDGGKPGILGGCVDDALVERVLDGDWCARSFSPESESIFDIEGIEGLVFGGDVDADAIGEEVGVGASCDLGGHA